MWASGTSTAGRIIGSVLSVNSDAVIVAHSSGPVGFAARMNEVRSRGLVEAGDRRLMSGYGPRAPRSILCSPPRL